MAEFFKDLEKHIEDGWDDIKQSVKDGVEDLADREPATPAMKAEEAEAAGIIEGMLQGNTLTSPCASTVASIVTTPGHTGLKLANQEGIIVALPEALQPQVRVLVNDGQAVEKGTPLMEFSPEALQACTIDLVSPETVAGADGSTERIIRVFGPVKPEEE